MTRVFLSIILLASMATGSWAGAWDDLLRLASIHAKAATFDQCKKACGRGGNAKSCCICFGGDWFGSLKGGHCA